MVHQDNLSKSFLIQDLQIYGFLLRNVGYHYHAGLMPIIVQPNLHHMLLMDLNGISNTEAEEFLVTGLTIQ